MSFQPVVCTTARRWCWRTVMPVAVVLALFGACALSVDGPLVSLAQAHSPTVPPPANNNWPEVWSGQEVPADPVPVRFSPPSAEHCRRLPGLHEVRWPEGPVQAEGERRRVYEASESVLKSEKAAAPVSDAKVASPAAKIMDRASAAPAPQGLQPEHQRPAHELVTAGVVDDNADFGEYRAYRERARRNGVNVRDRDVTERTLLEVTDAQGHPVHDAEVVVQRAGQAQPVLWARTDTAGRVWLHPRVFMSEQAQQDRRWGVAVRKGGAQGHTVWQRGQAQALQVQLQAAPQQAMPARLDLVFLVDATGSMGDEIAKLKNSMRAMAHQISQLPSRPDVCYGLVTYRDRGDAYMTRRHDFTNDLSAFQGVLAQVQADGGGDTPEALNEALSEAVHGMSWRHNAVRLVVLVADAPPHLDYCPGSQHAASCPQYDQEMQAALAKGIKLFAVGASGLDPSGEFIFRQMAQYTAGRFVFLTYQNASQPGSGPGSETVHDVKQYSVQTLDKLVVRLVSEELARLRSGAG